jgi:hypothetical protein
MNDTISVSIEVPLSLTETFELFTQRIDAWWKRGPQHRFRSPWTTGVLELIPGPAGRLVERFPDGEIVEIGRIRRWEPPHRFGMEWRLPIFAADEVTHVDIEFRAVDTGCRVEVRHGGWSHLRPDHPARHGLDDRQFLASHGRLWGELLSSLRNVALHQAPPPSRKEP